MKTLIIAEIGVNHNGSTALAKEMIQAAAEAGADVVKFQTYKATEVMTDQTPLADYMSDKEGSFLELAKKLELTAEQTIEVKNYTESLGVEFMSSPFDVPSTYFLAELGLTRLKIPSGEAVNPFVLKAAAKTGLPLIVSTGMCTLEEVQKSMNLLKLHHSGPVTLLHCTTQYPAAVENSNLKAMETLRKAFEVPIGYSDHTPGIEVSLAAVALGATVIEKHFTIDRSLPGPDQAASLLPAELRALVHGTRVIERALGHGRKEPYPIELEVAQVARKSLVTAEALPAGTIMSWQNLKAKRPGTGIPAWDIDLVLGKTINKDLSADALLKPEDFNE
jgi:N,N'-diacetyllegionaminate synthase